MADRKSHDIVLKEARKPAGYGNLVAVVKLDDGRRELWFQHPEDPSILRCAEIDLDGSSHDKTLTIKTKGERDRA